MSPEKIEGTEKVPSWMAGLEVLKKHSEGNHIH